MALHLEFGNHLKSLPHEDAIRATYLGQAHIAGTGPEGKTCRECTFWGVQCSGIGGAWKVVSLGYYSEKDKAGWGGQLHKGGCYRYRHRKSNRKFPHDAQACRLFEENENPPPAVKDVGADK